MKKVKFFYCVNSVGYLTDEVNEWIEKKHINVISVNGEVDVSRNYFVTVLYEDKKVE